MFLSLSAELLPMMSSIIISGGGKKFGFGAAQTSYE